MEQYLVGGAVRDIVLGHIPKDKDYVVVGGSEEEMLALGYTKVGAFPVFLHPETKEEYALARTERKVGVGYQGFETQTGKDVTLEDDLMRRDLTINSMAMTEDGQLVDPYNGKSDIQNKVLRHTSEAFRDDPVRVLRIARFLARFGPEWSIASETLELAKGMVAAGELHHLTPERVWKDVEKGLSEAHPELMIETLAALGVFALPPFQEYILRSDAPATVPALSIPSQFALFFGRVLGTGKGHESENSKVIPNAVKVVATRYAQLKALDYGSLSKEAQLGAIKQNQLVRQVDVADQVLAALKAVSWDGLDLLTSQVKALREVKASQVLSGIDHKDVPAIQKAIAAAELAAIQ